MAVVRDHYYGDVTVPLPELDRNEQAAVANLITQGLDQMAMRVSSTTPTITYPPVKPGQAKSEEYARIRRLANYGWWQANRFDRKARKRARWLIGYASAPAVIRPDPKHKIPTWHLRDPLSTWPGSAGDPDDIHPPDCIFTFRRTLAWLIARYPSATAEIHKGRNCSPDELFDIVEYVDCDEYVQVLVGKPKDPTDRPPYGISAPAPQGAQYAEMDRLANRAGISPAVVPTRQGLDRPAGQFDGMPGLYAMQARAMALWLLASERGIFPNEWFISRPNETVQVIERADGRAGIPGQVKGGDLKEVTVMPPPAVGQLIDLLERNQRVTAGIPSSFGGEQATNVRTGRASDSLLSATVDYWVQEAQETLGLAYVEENKIAVATAKAYFGNTPVSFYVDWKGRKGQADYTPNVHFENDNCTVAFPHPGADANNLIIGIGQRLGLGEMSLHTAMELDPLIDDPELEHERTVVEQMEKALLSSIDQAVAGGQLGPLEVARMTTLIFSQKMSVSDAVQRVHEETQKAQAATQAAQGPPAGAGAPPGGSPGPPGGGLPAGGPGAQPGIAAPAIAASMGAGGGQPPGEPIGPPPPSMQNLQALMQTLHVGGGGR